ncbi:hypothetical protein IGB42_02001 [Andreprevotia sp. IGB-42]|uniref:hypothetical protein n=1 Tax=Andreprevotia sp. IGB-42 TaxID=2497473 RepID=UPI00135CCC1C|nr:hypothetical protein [Andreprevotia sp. IGB-42]KAF0813650.1 hypothetical protein IGB42_02001 [Andreprevotia sp. IGB-42]
MAFARHCFKLFSSLLLLLCAAPALATPETGWWWNAAEGGRGFTIEVQDGKMFMAGFMYDDNGKAIWYASGPTQMVNDNTYVGVWQQYGGGQSLNGNYQSPTVVNANVGNITLTFSSPNSGTLVLPNGKQVALTRYFFGGQAGGVTSKCGSSNFNTTKYDAIALGMSLDQVKNIIGCTNDPAYTVSINNGNLKRLNWNGPVPGSSTTLYVITVYFDATGSTVTDIRGGTTSQPYFKESSGNLPRN